MFDIIKLPLGHAAWKRGIFYANIKVVGIIMKHFLKNNIITHNLMAFTGFKSILIFTSLVNSPKSYKELKQILENHPYLHETVSIDTLRVYINSLKEFGCNIVKVKENGITKFSISEHPFTLKFNDKQVKALIKVYKAVCKSIEVEDLMNIQQFFCKVSDYVDNEELKLKLRNISPLNNIDNDLLHNLMCYVNNNNEIIVLYNSPSSGHKNITILADKLYIQNNKLYISGYNSEHKNYSSFLVSKIIKIVGVNIQKKVLEVPALTVGYEYKVPEGEEFELAAGEKIINKKDRLLSVEITSLNKFEITQRILSLSPGCKVLYPEDYKKYIVSVLKKMKEGYFEK